jgi:Ras GTPase-activating-like protein IQGAP2/3
VIKGHPAYISVAVHYIRPKQAAFVREALQTVIKDVIDADDLDLEVDAAQVCTYATAGG